MEIKNRGMIKNKIALALYESYISNIILDGSEKCKPKDFKRYVQGHIDTDGELTEGIHIFFDLFAPLSTKNAQELIFNIYVRNDVISTKTYVFGNTLDNIIYMINDCVNCLSVDRGLFECCIAGDPIIQMNNKDDYCGMVLKYSVFDR